MLLAGIDVGNDNLFSLSCISAFFSSAHCGSEVGRCVGQIGWSTIAAKKIDAYEKKVARKQNIITFFLLEIGHQFKQI